MSVQNIDALEVLKKFLNVQILLHQRLAQCCIVLPTEPIEALLDKAHDAHAQSAHVDNADVEQKA